MRIKTALAGFDMVNRLNDKRLKAYYKSLQKKLGKLKSFYWCDTCMEYHYPSPDKRNSRDQGILEEISRVEEEKNNVIRVMKERVI